MVARFAFAVPLLLRRIASQRALHRRPDCTGGSHLSDESSNQAAWILPCPLPIPPVDSQLADRSASRMIIHLISVEMGNGQDMPRLLTGKTPRTHRRTACPTAACSVQTTANNFPPLFGPFHPQMNMKRAAQSAGRWPRQDDGVRRDTHSTCRPLHCILPHRTEPHTRRTAGRGTAVKQHCQRRGRVRDVDR